MNDEDTISNLVSVDEVDLSEWSLEWMAFSIRLPAKQCADVPMRRLRVCGLGWAPAMRTGGKDMENGREFGTLLGDQQRLKARMISSRFLCSSASKVKATAGASKDQAGSSHIKEASKYVASTFISSFAESLAFYLVSFGCVGVGGYFAYQYLKSLVKVPAIKAQENLDKISERISEQGRALAESANELKVKNKEVFSKCSEKMSSSIDKANDLKQKSIDGAKGLKEKIIIPMTTRDNSERKELNGAEEQAVGAGMKQSLQAKWSEGKARLFKTPLKEETKPIHSTTEDNPTDDMERGK
jgi:hypothetical protein